MVRLLVRDVVKFGHYKDYRAACKAWSEVAVELGLPAFGYYESSWGTANEVFLIGEPQLHARRRPAIQSATSPPRAAETASQKPAGGAAG